MNRPMLTLLMQRLKPAQRLGLALQARFKRCINGEA